MTVIQDDRPKVENLGVNRIRTDGFTDRDVYRNHWSLLSDKHQVQLAVAELAELDWLRIEIQTTQGRPKVAHRINPAARDMSA
ncbi:MAG: hypothetical protein JW810_10520 [Sedimentisphaerales bacterium]|nr:hypothetical protein [Sedimentisphaerales bacterium]